MGNTGILNMKLGELLKNDTMLAIKRYDRINESQFKDYVASDEEIDKEIKDAKSAIALHRQQGNAPLVAKFETRLEQALAKKKKGK